MRACQTQWGPISYGGACTGSVVYMLPLTMRCAILCAQVVQVPEHLTRLYEDLSTYTMTTEDCKRLLQSLQAVSSQATSGSG